MIVIVDSIFVGFVFTHSWPFIFVEQIFTCNNKFIAFYVDLNGFSFHSFFIIRMFYKKQRLPKNAISFAFTVNDSRIQVFIIQWKYVPQLLLLCIQQSLKYSNWSIILVSKAYTNINIRLNSKGSIFSIKIRFVFFGWTNSCSQYYTIRCLTSLTPIKWQNQQFLFCDVCVMLMADDPYSISAQ